MADKIWGKHPVKEAIKGGDGAISRVYLTRGMDPWLDDIRSLAKIYNVEVTFEDKKRLDALAGTPKHQGVVAILKESAKVSELDPLDLIYRANHLGEKPFFLILDHIQDPQNLGALLRSAEGSGCHGVVIPNRRGVSLNETVSKASAGASIYVPVACVANINQTIELFKKEGVWIVGADGASESSRNYFEQDFTLPTALVLGAEGDGLSHLTREKCDFLVKIPMKGKIASLNVSASGAVLMYELVRQRAVNQT